jgi:hypothetical protein
MTAKEEFAHFIRADRAGELSKSREQPKKHEIVNLDGDKKPPVKMLGKRFYILLKTLFPKKIGH